MMDDILDEFAPEQEHIVVPKVVYLFLIAFTTMLMSNCLYSIVDARWGEVLHTSSKWVLLITSLYAWRTKAFHIRGHDPYFNTAHLLLTIGFFIPALTSFLGLYFAVFYFLINSLFWFSAFFLSIRLFFVYKDESFNSSPVAFAFYSFFIITEFATVCLILDVEFGTILYWVGASLFSISTMINLVLLNQRGKQEALAEWMPLIIFLNVWAWGSAIRMEQDLIGSLMILGGIVGVALTVYRQNKTGVIQTF